MVGMSLLDTTCLYDQIGNEDVPRKRRVSVTLEEDWFQKNIHRSKQPSSLSVKRCWSMLKAPLDTYSSLQVMFLFKRSMLDWPKMGAAIAKLAEKEYFEAKAAKLLAIRAERRFHAKQLKMGKENSVRKHAKAICDFVTVKPVSTRAAKVADKPFKKQRK
jgi:hypothetical protein